MTLTSLVADPFIEDLKKSGQLAPRFNQALKQVNTNGFTSDLRTQSKVLWDTARLFQHVDGGQQRAALDTFGPCVPRIHRESNPELTLKNILYLPNEEDIYRCLTVGEVPPRPWVPDADEMLYPTDGWIGHYLRYARNNECNLAFHFWGIMGIVGSICQRKLYYDMGQFNIFLNSYMVLTGDSSSGKSIAASIAMNLLRRFNRRVVDREPEGPDDVSIIPNDHTPAYLIKLLDNRPYSRLGMSGIEDRGLRDATGLLFLDELATYLNKGAHGIEEKIPMLVQLQDAKNYDKGTAGEGEKYLHNCALSILGLAAPEWFKDSITPAVRKGGLMDRIMFVHRDESSRRYDLPLDPIDPLVAEGLVTDMISWAKLGRMVLEAEPSAHKWMSDYAQEFSYHRDNFPSRNDYVRSRKRQIIWVWRLAGLLAVTYGEAPYVSVERFEQATSLLLPEDRSTEVLMQTIEESPDGEMFRKLEQYIARQGGCVEHRKVTNTFYRRLQDSSKTVKQYMDRLEEAGAVHSVNYGHGKMYVLAEHERCPNCQLQPRRRK